MTLSRMYIDIRALTANPSHPIADNSKSTAAFSLVACAKLRVRKYPILSSPILPSP